jgi:hypothetical protein
MSNLVVLGWLSPICWSGDLKTHTKRFRESTPELSTPLSVLFSVVEDAHRYEGYLKDNAQEIYDHELAEFLVDLRDETASRAKRAEQLLAQRVADGGVH